MATKKSSKKDDGDGKFKSKNIKHDPQAESARAVFGLKKAERTGREEIW